uniref:Cathepsin propeptide inhibitor domain-containing protein n=1 Tax=Aegilops tauschii subsp. strangulata TaxID=200361 RepID=A0A453LNE3_AEGTS
HNVVVTAMDSSFSRRSLCLLLLAVCLHGSPATSRPATKDTDPMTLRMMEQRFRRWKAEHNRTYSTPEEERHRLRVYAHNVRYIEATNEDAGAGLTYELGETAYTDLTSDEFMAMYTSRAPPLSDDDDAPMMMITTRAGPVDAGGRRQQVYVNESAGAPASVDWRERGAVTAVKNQGQCGTLRYATWMVGRRHPRIHRSFLPLVSNYCHLLPVNTWLSVIHMLACAPAGRCLA